MRTDRRTVFCIICISILAIATARESAAASRVVLKTSNGRHQLLRNGSPYFINGAGGHTHLKQLVAAGGNSIRTWGTDNLDEILDAAQKHKLTVCVGLWLGHERHGFNYQNQQSVVEQLETSLAAIRKYKDHPAVLMWGIGNEMEGAGNNPAIWYAVNHIARECKRIDPNHPTMTVIAELGESKVQNIERFCPDIDIIGVNSYGGLTSMAKRYHQGRPGSNNGNGWTIPSRRPSRPGNVDLVGGDGLAAGVEDDVFVLDGALGDPPPIAQELRWCADRRVARTAEAP